MNFAPPCTPLGCKSSRGAGYKRFLIRRGFHENQSFILLGRIAVGALLGALLTLGSGAAQAGPHTRAVWAETVYGVAPYYGAQGTPKFIGDNVTGFNDVMASPAAPSSSLTLLAPTTFSRRHWLTPCRSSRPRTAAGNAFGAFGSGATNLVGPNFAFRLSDSNPGGGSLSYWISTMTSNFTIRTSGCRGNLGTYLAIGGTLSGVNDSAAACAGVAILSQWRLPRFRRQHPGRRRQRQFRRSGRYGRRLVPKRLVV